MDCINEHHRPVSSQLMTLAIARLKEGTTCTAEVDKLLPPISISVHDDSHSPKHTIFTGKLLVACGEVLQDFSLDPSYCTSQLEKADS